MTRRGDDTHYLCPTLEIQSITLVIDSIITGIHPSLALAVSLEESTPSANLDYDVQVEERGGAAARADV